MLDHQTKPPAFSSPSTPVVPSGQRYSVLITGLAETMAEALEETWWTLEGLDSIEFKYDGLDRFLGVQLTSQWSHLDTQLKTLVHSLPASVETTSMEIHPVQAIAPEDWAESWKQHWQITRLLPQLIIQPSWLPYTAQAGETVIKLDPGMAFGTGTHETTRLMLSVLSDMVTHQTIPKTASVIDVGTGSGILSLFLALQGFTQLTATDIQPNVIDVVADNLVMNQLPADRIETNLKPLWEFEAEQFDLVLANIIALVLEELMPDLVRLLQPDGWLILGGITRAQLEGFLAQMSAYPVLLKDILIQGEWVSLVYQRPRT